MARTRSVKIREELDELDQLRQFYAEKPEARRILFLMFLKEDSKCTVSEAARKVRISSRRGRYWWDAYRNGGLRNLLDRRVWKKSEIADADSSDSIPTASGEQGPVSEDSAWVSFLNRVAVLANDTSDARRWVNGFKSNLQGLLSGVDFVGMTVMTGIDVLSPGTGKLQVLNEVGSESKVLDRSMSSSRDDLLPYEVFLEQGRRGGFPFENYRSDPVGFDYFLQSGKRERAKTDETDSYIASIVLLRLKHESPIPQSTIDLMERLRPFVTFCITDFLVRTTLESGGGGQLENLIRKVAGASNLTAQESRVLLLGFLGRSYQEIADQLHVSVNTVQTHIRAIYRKTGVSKLGEIYAKFFSGVQLPDAPEES